MGGEPPLRGMKLVTIVLAAFVSACMASGYQGGGGLSSYGGNQGYASNGQGATAGTYGTAYGTTTATYVNGYELTLDEKAQLEQRIGYTLPAGRYHLDAQYNFAREGEAPFDNLERVAQANAAANGEAGGTGRAWSMHSRDSAGNGSTLVDDGNGCMIMSTPSGSISSGC